MAEKDGNDKYNHRTDLFTKNNEPLCFHMRCSEERAKIGNLIRHGGGRISGKNNPGSVRLVSKSEMFVGEAVSSKFIWDSVTENKLMNVEDYKVHEESVDDVHFDEEDGEEVYAAVSESQAKKLRVCTTVGDLQIASKKPINARSEYTYAEEDKIIKFIIKHRSFHKVGGNDLWKRLEEAKVLKNRSWQSMKERFRRKILPRIGSFKLSEADVKLFKSKGKLSVFVHREDVNVSSDSDTIFDDSFQSDSGKSYTLEEDQKILNFVIENDMILETGGKTMWETLALTKVVNRTWQSAKERYRKVIIHNLSRYNVSQADRREIKDFHDVHNNDDDDAADNSGTKHDQNEASPLTPKKVPGETPSKAARHREGNSKIKLLSRLGLQPNESYESLSKDMPSSGGVDSVSPGCAGPEREGESTASKDALRAAGKPDESVFEDESSQPRLRQRSLTYGSRGRIDKPQPKAPTFNSEGNTQNQNSHSDVNSPKKNPEKPLPPFSQQPWIPRSKRFAVERLSTARCVANNSDDNESMSPLKKLPQKESVITEDKQKKSSVLECTTSVCKRREALKDCSTKGAEERSPLKIAGAKRDVTKTLAPTKGLLYDISMEDADRGKTNPKKGVDVDLGVTSLEKRRKSPRLQATQSQVPSGPGAVDSECSEKQKSKGSPSNIRSVATSSESPRDDSVKCSGRRDFDFSLRRFSVPRLRPRPDNTGGQGMSRSSVGKENGSNIALEPQSPPTEAKSDERSYLRVACSRKNVGLSTVQSGACAVGAEESPQRSNDRTSDSTSKTPVRPSHGFPLAASKRPVVVLERLKPVKHSPENLITSPEEVAVVPRKRRILDSDSDDMEIVGDNGSEAIKRSVVRNLVLVSDDNCDVFAFDINEELNSWSVGEKDLLDSSVCVLQKRCVMGSESDSEAGLHCSNDVRPPAIATMISSDHSYSLDCTLVNPEREAKLSNILRHKIFHSMERLTDEDKMHVLHWLCANLKLTLGEFQKLFCHLVKEDIGDFVRNLENLKS